MQGYLGDREATALVLRDGWLDTGDLGFAAGGELFVHGRAKDAVIVRGANHAPEEFEACLEGLPGLRPGCAVALGATPDGGDGEELLVLAERATGRPAQTPARSRKERWAGLEEAVRRAILERTGVRAHAVRILEPGTLPRTSSGKMRRGEALRRFLDGSLSAPRRAGSLSLARDMARSALAYLRVRRSAGPEDA
jgi:acyl-CoA synthetase (AMP-forming)/AMP-acid ligase II